MPIKKIVEIGSKIGMLTIVKELDRIIMRKTSFRMFECKCDCGNIKILRLSDIRPERNISCGCNRFNGTTVHGKSNHRLYSIWSSMIERCENPDNKSYKNYGERGITVCTEWHNINNFINDMYESYKEGLTIDRIDNSKGYYKSNCRWVSMYRQSRNRRSNRVIEFENELYTITDLAIKLNLSRPCLHYRIKNNIPLNSPLGMRKVREIILVNNLSTEVK